jgi:DNA-binding response OmpR family regulator
MATRKSLSPGKPQKTILVVDDDTALRELVTKTLSVRYKVVAAADGLAAADILGKPPIPDLMVCDVMMPKIDGFSLAKLIRAKPELARLPIIFLTAKTAPAAVMEGIRLGAKHYIQKPFAIKELLAKVDKLLQ